MCRALYLTLLALLAALALAQGIKLQRVPKVGEEVRYRIQTEFDLAGVSAYFSALLIERVASVDAAGSYTIETRQTQVRIRYGATEQPKPDSQTASATYSTSGEPLEIKAGDPTGIQGRIARMNAFIAPAKEVSVGDTWQHEFKPTPFSGGIGARVEYKALKLERIAGKQALAVRFEFKERSEQAPAEATGTAWLDAATGDLLKLEGAWKNAPLFDARTPVDAKVTLTRE